MSEINSNVLPEEVEDSSVTAATPSSEEVFENVVVEDVGSLPVGSVGEMETSEFQFQEGASSSQYSEYLFDQICRSMQDLDSMINQSFAEKDINVAEEVPERDVIGPRNNSTNTSGSENQTFEGEGSAISGNEDVELDAENALALMQLLINDNKLLRKQLKQTEAMVRFIMSKYRQSVTYLVAEPDQTRSVFTKVLKGLETDGLSKVAEIEQIGEMKEVLFAAARLDDEYIPDLQSRVVQLQKENQGLRKVVQIAKDFGSPCLSTQSDKAVQTEDDVNSVYSDDDFSFYTAGSPLGSRSSMTMDDADENQTDFESGSDDSVPSSCVTVQMKNDTPIMQ